MKKDPLSVQGHFILAILAIQYLFGMFVNLFVSFPNTTNETVQWKFAEGQWTIVIHIILGFGLLIGSIVLLIRAIRKKNKNWIIAGSVGLFAILVAVIAGSRFIPTQQDVYSFLMASAFILAVIAYVWGMYKAKKLA